MYPYTIRDSDKEFLKIMNKIKKQGYIIIENNVKSREISKKLRPIRKDWLITNDRRIKKSIIAKDPSIIINIKKNKRYNDFKFTKKY